MLFFLLLPLSLLASYHTVILYFADSVLMSTFLNELMQMIFAPRCSMEVLLCAELESKIQSPGGTQAPASLGSGGLNRAPKSLQASEPQVSIFSSIFSSLSSLQSLFNSSGRLQIEQGSSSAASRSCDPWARTCARQILPPQALHDFPQRIRAVRAMRLSRSVAPSSALCRAHPGCS